MVATVLGASFRFSMCPDIWLSSSTAYLNMKGTITLVSWEGRVGFKGETGEDTFKQTIKPTYVHLCMHTRHALKEGFPLIVGNKCYCQYAARYVYVY